MNLRRVEAIIIGYASYINMLSYYVVGVIFTVTIIT